MFAINEENDIDQEFKVRQALVYTISEKVFHPHNPTTEMLSYCTAKMGVFRSPNVVMEWDDLGNVTKSTVVGWSNRFYIPWDNGNSACKVIDEFGGKYRDTLLATSKESGNEWHTGNTYSVFNLQEWLESDFDDLLATNRGGFLKPEYGGTVQYLRDRDQKRQRLEAEVKEFEGRNKKGDKTKS